MNDDKKYDLKRWYKFGKTGGIRVLPLGVSFFVTASFSIIFVLIGPFYRADHLQYKCR